MYQICLISTLSHKERITSLNL